MVGKLASFSSVALLAFAGLAAMQDAKPVAPTTFKVDDVHSSAFFRVQHLGAGQFWGRFNKMDGSFTLADDASKVAFDITVAVDSVDTAEPKLDAHLKSPDFFNAAEFPSMTFKSKSAKKTSGNMWDVVGDFTMHGVTKEVTAQIEITGMADMGMGSRAGAEAIFTVKRSDFGMNYGVEKGSLGNSVRVLVNLEGVAAK
ncbi:MAG: YceI family protein [Planctomycetaceae bacterium]|jgi:polyisoprenoid-binding protein YceI|nr:YceI family protein [Planctomycetaceae bacterium]